MEHAGYLCMSKERVGGGVGEARADRQSWLCPKGTGAEGVLFLDLQGLFQDCWLMAHDINEVLITVSAESEPKARPQEAQVLFGTSVTAGGEVGASFPTGDEAHTLFRVLPPPPRNSNSFPSFPWHHS